MAIIMNHFRPIKKPHTNFTLTAPPGDKDVLDLPCTRAHFPDGREAIISTWCCYDLEIRKKFYETGEISLISFSQTHPPIALMVGDFFGENAAEKGQNSEEYR